MIPRKVVMFFIFIFLNSKKNICVLYKAQKIKMIRNFNYQLILQYKKREGYAVTACCINKCVDGGHLHLHNNLFVKNIVLKKAIKML